METPTVNSSRNQAQCDDSVKCVSLITQGPGYRELTCFEREGLRMGLLCSCPWLTVAVSITHLSQQMFPSSTCLSISLLSPATRCFLSSASVALNF